MRRTATGRAWTAIYEDRIQALNAEVATLKAALAARGDDAARSWWVAWNPADEFIAAIYGTALTRQEMQRTLDNANRPGYATGHLVPVEAVIKVPCSQSAKGVAHE